MCSAEFAKKQNLKPMARLVAYAHAGVDPQFMGLGPIPAVKRLGRGGARAPARPPAPPRPRPPPPPPPPHRPPPDPPPHPPPPPPARDVDHPPRRSAI
jgi:hypothetical protein